MVCPTHLSMPHALGMPVPATAPCKACQLLGGSAVLAAALVASGVSGASNASGTVGLREPGQVGLTRATHS